MPVSVVHLDTSKLDDIIAAVSEKTRRYTIADGVEYGIFQEMGTTKIAARPFLVPAFETKTQGIEKVLGQAIERGASLDDVLGKVAFDVQREAQQNIQTKHIIDTRALLNSIHVEIE